MKVIKRVRKEANKRTTKRQDAKLAALVRAKEAENAARKQRRRQSLTIGVDIVQNSPNAVDKARFGRERATTGRK